MAFQLLLLVALAVLTCHQAHGFPVKMVGSGGTTVQNIFGGLSKQLNGRYNVQITYNAVGSGAGRKQFINQATLFCETDVPLDLKEEAMLRRYTKFTLPFALQTITVFNTIPGNPGIKLNAPLVARIFQGLVTTWDHPAVKYLNPSVQFPKGQRIHVVVRKDLSGSTQLLLQYLSAMAPNWWKLGSGGTAAWPASFTRAPLAAGVAAAMKAVPYSIGYAGTGAGLALSLHECMLQNAGGNYLLASQSDVLAAIPRPLPALTYPWSAVTLIAQRGPQTWPITSFAYLLARQNQVQVGAPGGVLKAWLRYLFTPSTQSLLQQYHFYPIPGTQRVLNLAAVNSILLAPGTPVPVFV